MNMRKRLNVYISSYQKYPNKPLRLTPRQAYEEYLDLRRLCGPGAFIVFKAVDGEGREYFIDDIREAVREADEARYQSDRKRRGLK